MKSILQTALSVFARLTIYRFRPKIIGITGSVGKTSTRLAIATVLGTKYRIRTAEKNYNTEIGLPLTILGIRNHKKNVIKWCAAFFGVLWRILFLKKRAYPEILILEYGVDRPGDMDRLVAIARPDIAVVTSIGDVPVHVEFFDTLEALIKEKEKLVRSLAPGGSAVLCHDDYAVYGMKEAAEGRRVMTYGFERDADVRIANGPEVSVITDIGFGKAPEGISFKIEYKGMVIPVRIHETFGVGPAYAAAAAFAVGSMFNMNLVEVSESLANFRTPPGRLRLLAGIKHSLILDDTYNAAPESMRNALETLRSLPSKRKIAVLGDMLEIGKYSEGAHRAIGDLAAEVLDILFTVGPRGKIIANEAGAPGIGDRRRVLKPEAIQTFDDSRSAGSALDPLIREGDLILVKGSRAMRMEKVVQEIMRHPENTEAVQGNDSE